MRGTRAKQIRKVAVMITPPKMSVMKIYRRIKKGYTTHKLHFQTINMILQNKLNGVNNEHSISST